MSIAYYLIIQINNKLFIITKDFNLCWLDSDLVQIDKNTIKVPNH